MNTNTGNSLIDESESTPDDNIDAITIESRKEIRETIDDQVAQFIASGGQIEQVEANVTADPPQKPTSNYGSRPI